DQHEGPEEAQEVLLEGVLLLLGQLGARQALDALGEHGVDAPGELLLADALLGADHDARHLAGWRRTTSSANSSVNAAQVIGPWLSASPKVARPTIVTSTGSGVRT